MSDNKKAGEGTFLDKVTGFFKKAGAWCKETAIKVSGAVVEFAKKAWAWFLAIDWNASVKPVVAWGVFGGVVALSVILMLIFWL